jgi:hypothetical protein
LKKLIWAMVVELMGCMGAFLTLVDIHEYFTDEKVEIGLFRLFIGCAILVLFVNFVWKTLVFQCKFHGNRIIKIRFGNILKRKDGTVLVPINDRLYSRRNIGRRNTGSMHDQLMDGRYGDAIAMALSKEAQCVGASNGEHAPMGHHFSVKTRDGKYDYLFFVSAHFQKENLASSSYTEVRLALRKLFLEQADFAVRNNTLYMPVIGAGCAGLCYEDAIRMIAQEYILSCTHQKDDTPVRAQTLVIMLRPQDVFKRALDIMTLCDEIETMVKVCGSCKIYR